MSLPHWVCDLFPYYCDDGRANSLFTVILVSLGIGTVIFAFWMALDEDGDDWYWTPVLAGFILVLVVCLWFCISLIVTGWIVWMPLRITVAGFLILALVTLFGRVIRRLLKREMK